MRRLVACCAALVLLLLGATPAWADAPDEPTTAAAQWMVRNAPATNDIDGASDRVIGLAAAGVPADRLSPAVQQLAFLLKFEPTITTESLARGIVALDVAGQDVHGAVGRDLATELRGRVGTAGAVSGQFPAESGTEIATQAWSVLALLRVGVFLPEAVKFLAAQQCANGAIVFAPTASTCAQAPDALDQGLALAALVAAQRQPGGTWGTTVNALVGWLDSQRDPSGEWPGLPVSALGYARPALQLWGASSEADAAACQIAALQFRAADATNPLLAGGYAETADLKRDFIANSLMPSVSTASAALVGLRVHDLAADRYQPMSGWNGLPTQGAQDVALPSAAVKGAHIRLVATGFPAGTTVRWISAKNRSEVAHATATQEGVATVELDTSSLLAGDLTLTAEGGGASASTTITVQDPGSGAKSTDTSQAAQQARAGWTWPQVAGVAAGAIAVLFAGAWLLRGPQNQAS